ncbi:protein phosphatase 1B [Aricia agestis]|uniref:protein phosphatase 1B n=1 Tax=Aricia agestis TaxID=91739 RepID=UPI001C20A259|nr:protein phosphatase 1B [Aricia agestis]
MPASIGVNLRVTGHCSQGGRKYMEDLFSVAYQQTEDERDLEYAFFGIYDGHGGGEAAAFAKEHLMGSIVKQRQFWSDNDEDVLKAIRNGYMLTHLNMWKEVEKWPKTVTGLPSTAGTTASVAFIRRGKIYIGHVGDSAIVLGYQKDGCDEWAAKPLTLDHKPESAPEIDRIQKCGGKVVAKAGVPRVVWNRPRLEHKGPIKKNAPIDEIPFLAVARSLGDLWSYNPQNDEFIVSPDPDVGVLTIDPTKFRCLIFGTDGLWNMISPESAVNLVQATEKHNEAALVGGNANQPRDWLNPSKSLVDHALERWSNTRMRADNTSVVTLMLDPPGPPRATVLLSRSSAQKPQPTTVPPTVPVTIGVPDAPSKSEDPKTDVTTESEPETRPVPQNGLTIMTRYSDVDKPSPPTEESPKTPLPPCATLDGRFSVGHRDESPKADDNTTDQEVISNYGNPAESYFMVRLLNRSRIVNTLSDVYEEIVNGQTAPAAREPSPSPTTALSDAALADPVAPPADVSTDETSIQINEVSSSSPTEAPPRPRARKVKTETKRDTPVVASNDRVLRSHHEVETPSRPRTRLAAGRARPAEPAPVERVVILTRRTPAAPPRADRPPDEDRRVMRSQNNNGPTTRAADVRGAGNCYGAPGTRRAPAARREAARGRSKENMGGALRRVRACAVRAEPSPPRGRARRPGSAEPEVHSTTSERALRSRNEPDDRPPAKRPRAAPAAPPPAKRPAWSRSRLRRRLHK